MQCVVMKPFHMGKGTEKVGVGAVVDTGTIRNARVLISQRFLEPCHTTEGDLAGEYVLSEVQMKDLADRILAQVGAGELGDLISEEYIETLLALGMSKLTAVVEAACERLVSEQLPLLVEAAQATAKSTKKRQTG